MQRVPPPTTREWIWPPGWKDGKYQPTSTDQTRSAESSSAAALLPQIHGPSLMNPLCNTPEDVPSDDENPLFRGCPSSGSDLFPSTNQGRESLEKQKAEQAEPNYWTDLFNSLSHLDFQERWSTMHETYRQYKKAPTPEQTAASEKGDEHVQKLLRHLDRVTETCPIRLAELQAKDDEAFLRRVRYGWRSQ